MKSKTLFAALAIMLCASFASAGTIQGTESTGSVTDVLVDSAGRLRIDIAESSSMVTDDSAFVPGTDSVIMGGFFFDDVAPDSVSEGDGGAARMSANRNQYMNIRDAGGDEYGTEVNEFDSLKVHPFGHGHLDQMEATTGWTVLGNDTVNLATTVNHVEGQYALEFDKVDGAANTIFAGIQKTITSADISEYIESNGFMNGNFYISALTDVAYIFMRAGTDSSNYSEWRIDDDDAVAGWNLATVSITTPSTIVGNGLIHTAVTYMALGVAMDLETSTLADIAMDHIGMISGQTVTATLAATTNLNTPNINLHRVAGTPVETDQGGGTSSTQRVASALLDFEADEPANCVAITSTTAQFTMPASEMFNICASAGTAYVLCGANPTATTTVTTGFSFVVQDGQCLGPMIINEAKCAVIGTVTQGNLCFMHME